MPTNRLGPPGKSGPAPAQEPAPTTPSNEHHNSRSGRQCTGDSVGAQLRRRRMASWRCEPLDSGHRDPHHRWRPEKLSAKQLEAVAAAAEHLDAAGLSAIFDVDVLRELWRSGDRELAQRLYELAGGDA